MQPFVLSYEPVTAGEAEPKRWMYVLHGVFGSRSNWRLFMKRVVAACPDWGFLLVDLRGHASSQGAQPPHDIAAMAADLVALDDSHDYLVRGVFGHSLGGKVAQAYAAERGDELDEVWVVDTQPGVRVHDPKSPSYEVLALLEGLPHAFRDRSSFVKAVEGGGQSRAIATWLSMNVHKAGDEHVLALDLPAIRSILTDFYRRDDWAALEPIAGRNSHLVVAEKSFVWADGDDDRIAALADKGLHVHRIADAGHWVHVDAPEALQQVIVDALTRAPG